MTYFLASVAFWNIGVSRHNPVMHTLLHAYKTSTVGDAIKFCYVLKLLYGPLPP